MVSPEEAAVIAPWMVAQFVSSIVQVPLLPTLTFQVVAACALKTKKLLTIKVAVKTNNDFFVKLFKVALQSILFVVF